MGSYSDGGWLDISSAPKDGTSVLVGGGTYAVHDYESLAHSVSIAYWSSINRHWHGNEANAHDEYCVVSPTHWMPLPPPPSPIQHNNTDLVPARRADEHGDS